MEWVVGIDEVGRGALAGPVVVAAVAIPRRFVLKTKELGSVRDSKQLSPLARERWAAYLRCDSRIFYALARVNPRGIERLNISRAANVAALRALTRLLASGNVPKDAAVYLDGGLYAGNGRKRLQNTKTIIKADETIPAVAAASIIAKVSRDKFMRQLGKRYPAYGFGLHKGYGTRFHQAMIRKNGPCDVHRLTFIKGGYTIHQ